MKLESIINVINFIGKAGNLKTTYKEIKQNPESREVSVVMGKKATRYNILFLILIALAVGSAMLAFNFLNQNGILLGIIFIGCAIGLILWAIGVGILAFTSTILQLKLNKKPIGIINLVFSIVVVLLAVIGVFIITIL